RPCSAAVRPRPAPSTNSKTLMAAALIAPAMTAAQHTAELVVCSAVPSTADIGSEKAPGRAEGPLEVAGIARATPRRSRGVRPPGRSDPADSQAGARYARTAMRYLSTRGRAPEAAFADVLLDGLAPDGGLYLPAAWPALSAEDLAGAGTRPYAETAEQVLT